MRGIRFRRNFGKAAALNAGFRAARGETIITLDADLQDDPHEIPKFLAKIDEGCDVVSGWKQVRHDPWHKVLPSRVFNWLVSHMTGVRLHDHNCGMKSYRREVFDEVRLYGELHRFVPVLADARGFRIGEVVINHRPRKFGKSKYGVSRIAKGFFDLLTVKFLTGFGQRPQHLLGMVGLLFFFLGFLGLGLPECVLGADASESAVELAAAPRTTGLAVFAGIAIVGRTIDVDWLSGRIDHRLPRPGYRRLFDRRTIERTRQIEPMSTAPQPAIKSPQAADVPAIKPPPATRHPWQNRHRQEALPTIRDAKLRRSIYALLIAISAGIMIGRVLAVNSVDQIGAESVLKNQGRDDWQKQRPFLSGNDRSRWLTMRALVEKGTYAIDQYVTDPKSYPNWDTIDMVMHQDATGERTFTAANRRCWQRYMRRRTGSSIKISGAIRGTPVTLSSHPYEIGRGIILLVNVLPLMIYFFVLAKIVERFGQHRLGADFCHRGRHVLAHFSPRLR